jgi:tetratricopeptide (TPR) repeat protein
MEDINDLVKFHPCNHAQTCSWCARLQCEASNLCPICCIPIEKFTFLSKRDMKEIKSRGRDQESNRNVEFQTNVVNLPAHKREKQKIESRGRNRESDVNVQSTTNVVNLSKCKLKRWVFLLALVLNFGLTRDQQGNLQGANSAYQTSFEAAVEADPTLAGAHFYLGMTHAQRGDLAGAISAYEAAVKADPKYATAHFNLGATRDMKGDREGAILAYEAAVNASIHIVNSKF